MCEEKRELKMSDIEMISSRHINVDLNRFTPVERAMITSEWTEHRGISIKDEDDGTFTLESFGLTKLNEVINKYESERVSEVN